MILDDDIIGGFFFFILFCNKKSHFSYNESFYLIIRKVKVFKEEKILIKLPGVLLVYLLSKFVDWEEPIQKKERAGAYPFLERAEKGRNRFTIKQAIHK